MKPEAQDPIFERLLEYLKDSRGFDFRGYKRSTLHRRVRKRMEAVGIQGFGDYQGYLEEHPDEFHDLFNTILINVTRFFRDPESWDFLSSEVIPRMLADKKPEEAIRVWSVGCASGPEAYTLAMVLGEILGVEPFVQRVKIYATDVDELDIAVARTARYSAANLKAVPETLRARYFEPVEKAFIFRSDMRRCMIFGRHDALVDPPISRLDLLVCRNTLMYFQADAQKRILGRFYYALGNAGYLFLGKSEMLVTHTELFSPVNLRHRIFQKVSKAGLWDRPEAKADVVDEGQLKRLGP